MGLAALLLLFWTCRGALFGVPTADDYDYLYSMRFDRFDPFGPMGSLSYWRPIGRQLYYAVWSPFLFDFPLLGTLLHAGMLFVVFFLVMRAARRAFAPLPALLGGAFVLTSEPTRALLVWPTGGEYLLALLGAAFAVHEALAERWRTAALAALCAVLAHEGALLLFAALPLLAWRQVRGARDRVAVVAPVAAAAAIWLVGRMIASRRGAGWLDWDAPVAGSAAAPPAGEWFARIPLALSRSGIAQGNLEDLYGVRLSILAFAYGAIALTALVVLVFDRRARGEIRGHAAPLAGALLWFLAGVLPLALLLPDWNAWRTPLPSLWLGVAVVGGLALLRPWLAIAFVLVRVTAMLLAPPAPTTVEAHSPHTTSGMSFPQIVRLQRVADSARRALLASQPNLPERASIGFWSRLPYTEVALLPPKAPRVWFGDSTITWDWYWAPGNDHARHAAVLAFDPSTARPAVVLDQDALAACDSALRRVAAGDLLGADASFVQALRAQSSAHSRQFAGWVQSERARIALAQEAWMRADTLNEASFLESGGTAMYYGIGAYLAVGRGDHEWAREAIRRSLSLDPLNAYALAAARALSPPPKPPPTEAVRRSSGSASSSAP